MAYAKYILVVLAMLIATSVIGCAQVYGDGLRVADAREREIIIIEPDEETDYC
jgi:hypothetical protein